MLQPLVAAGALPPERWDSIVQSVRETREWFRSQRPGEAIAELPEDEKASQPKYSDFLTHNINDLMPLDGSLRVRRASWWLRIVGIPWVITPEGA